MNENKKVVILSSSDKKELFKHVLKKYSKTMKDLSDTGENEYNEGLRRGYVGGTPGEKCEHCNLTYGKEGHDACLGTLIGTMNACCGHGDVDSAYIQFLDGEGVYGEDAITIQNILKKNSR